MKKRIFSMLLAVALILSLGVTSVMAAGEKFDNKNNVNIVYFGGSQTQVGLEEGGWCHMITDWFSQNYTGSTFNTIDASYGGMGSNWGFMRAKADVISKNADIVFIDFATNDGSVYPTINAVNEENALSYIEAMVRNIMSAKEAPKIFFVYVARPASLEDPTVSRKDWYNKIAEYYGIPVIDSLDDFAALESLDGLYRADNVHLSAEGSKKLGEFAIADLSTEGFIKAPTLKSDLYIHANRYSAYSPDEYKVVDLYNEGKLSTTGTWEVVDQTETAPSFIGNMDLQYINPTSTDSTFSYEFKGDMIGFKFIVSPDGGDADVYVDDVLKGTLVMNTTSTFPNAFMWRNLGDGWHTLKVVPKNTEANCYIEKIYTAANAELHPAQSVVTNEVISNPISLTCNSIAFMGNVGWNTGLEQQHYIHTINKLNFIYRPSMKLLLDENNMIVSKRTGVKYNFQPVTLPEYYNGAIAVLDEGYTVNLGNVNANSVNFVATARTQNYPNSVDIPNYKVTINYTDGSSEDTTLTIYDYLANNDSLIASTYIIQGNNEPVMDAKYNMFEYSVPVKSGKAVKSITFGANQTSIMVYAVTTVAGADNAVNSETIELPNKNAMTYYEGPGWTTGQDEFADVLKDTDYHIHRSSLKAKLDDKGFLTSQNTGVKYDFSPVLGEEFSKGATITTSAGYTVDLGGSKYDTVNFIATVRDTDIDTDMANNIAEDLENYKVTINYTDGTTKEETLTIHGYKTSNSSVIVTTPVIRGWASAYLGYMFNMFEYSIPVDKEVQSITFNGNQAEIIVFAISGKLEDEKNNDIINTVFDITNYCDARPTAKEGETGNQTGRDLVFRDWELIVQDDIEKHLDSDYCYNYNGMKYSFAHLQTLVRRAIYVEQSATKTIDVGGDYYSKIGFFAGRRTDNTPVGTFPVTLNYADGTSETKTVEIGKHYGEDRTFANPFGTLLMKPAGQASQTSNMETRIYNYEIEVKSDKPLISVTFGGSSADVSAYIYAFSALGKNDFEASNGALKTEKAVVEDLSVVAGEKVNLTFKTKAVSETKYDLMVAFYSENGTKLEKIDYYNCKNNLGIKNEALAIEIPENAGSDWTVKAFLWNDAAGMIPIHDALIIQ